MPVLATEAVAALAPRDGDAVVDATFGAGGYARMLLAAAGCRVLGLDRDPDAAARAQALLDAEPDRFAFRAGRFSAMEALAAEAGFAPADGVAMDLGTSSPQLDQAERGFSFMRDGPLDMRMEKAGPSAADIVNDWDEATLAKLFRELGEERGARAAARAVCAGRPFARTGALADAIAGALAGRYRGQPIHPATRCFQALRIAVNDELGELDRGLAAAERLLRPGGRLAVVSFHSLEDRAVKRFLRDRSDAAAGPSRHMPDAPRRAPSFRLLRRSAVAPSDAETAANPRARSAKLRAAERTDAPAWPEFGSKAA